MKQWINCIWIKCTSILRYFSIRDS